MFNHVRPFTVSSFINLSFFIRRYVANVLDINRYFVWFHVVSFTSLHSWHLVWHPLGHFFSPNLQCGTLGRSSATASQGRCPSQSAVQGAGAVRRRPKNITKWERDAKGNLMITNINQLIFGMAHPEHALIAQVAQANRARRRRRPRCSVHREFTI